MRTYLILNYLHQLLSVKLELGFVFLAARHAIYQ